MMSSTEGDGGGRKRQGSVAAFRSGAPEKPLGLRLWELLQPLARLWGLVTAVAMFGAGSELLVLGYHVAPGILVGGAVVLVLETMWVAALFVDIACRRGEYHGGLRAWDLARWCLGRARAPLYACGATAMLLARLSSFTTLAGSFLLVLAALRALVPFSPLATRGVHSPRAGSALLSQREPALPDVFYNAAVTSADDRSEEMAVLEVKVDRSRSVTPSPSGKPPLLEI